jgi:hypothetical protein
MDKTTVKTEIYKNTRIVIEKGINGENVVSGSNFVSNDTFMEIEFNHPMVTDPDFRIVHFEERKIYENCVISIRETNQGDVIVGGFGFIFKSDYSPFCCDQFF